MGLSFGKLLVLVAVIAIVWFGFRLLREMVMAPEQDGRRYVRRRRKDEAVIDLDRNPRTGAYEPKTDDSGRNRSSRSDG